MDGSIGPLVAADEGFCHQIADTFAIVGQSDLSWTEKVCAMAAARDGSLQIGFGLGKYANRNVMDGYGGISRGVEQITVRSSRRLAPRPDHTVVGPLQYEVIKPLHQIRFALEANACQPIAFDFTFESIVPPTLEPRTHQRTSYRTTGDLVRYHQTGVASGWVEVDGERTEITPDTWVSTRDHSWGVRYDVGQAIADLEPSEDLSGVAFRLLWSPVYMEKPDGTQYALFLNYRMFDAAGYRSKEVAAAIEHPNGLSERIVDIEPDLRYDPANRRLLGGTLQCTLADGTERPLEIEAVSDTGFHLGAGLYFGLDGHHHGGWRGKRFVEGERIEDCSTPENARRLHQIRDTVIHVVDPVGGGEGWGNCQPIVTGGDPALGLSADDSFI
ncbi:MAG TPA: hypothetical protein VGO78_27300 [Acidimicrobiales bacterium]|jgi:hypothetical protein|nr:hypothetical protein [Acidimicrobiales bacterium]